MKKLKYLLFIIPLFLVSCIRPPVPDVEQAIQDSDPNTIIPLSNDSTEGYFMTALPLQPSPIRGLIHTYIRNRADIEQVEKSLMRLATEYFNPDDGYFFREGQYLERDFVLNVLQAHNPEIENHRGLNPAVGSSISFRGEVFENGQEGTESIRPLAYLLEQNFATVQENEDGGSGFQLEGVAIAIALNPYHWVVDRTIGSENEYRMTDDEIIEIGESIAADLLPLLRQEEGLEDVPIILGLYILRSYREVIPGGFARIAHIESGRSINYWKTVHEQHFMLPDLTSAINEFDVNINDQFNFFKNNIGNYFPHHHGIVARAHVVNSQVYRISIVFNMSFYGFSEKLGFHQFLVEQIGYFSPEYDIRIIVRNPSQIHGSVTRPPNGEATIHQISW